VRGWRLIQPELDASLDLIRKFARAVVATAGSDVNSQHLREQNEVDVKV